MLMSRTQVRRRGPFVALVALALIVAACGSDGDGDAADTTEAAAAAEEATTTTATADEDTTTTTDEATTTTVEDTTTTEAAAEVEADEPGTGILTVGGVEYAVTVTSCSFETVLNDPIADLPPTITYFELLGETAAEGRTVNVWARDIDLGFGEISSSIGYNYTDDPNDFEKAVSVSSAFGEGRFLQLDGTTVTAGPVPFDRVMGITTVRDDPPGDGSLVATCP